MYRIDFSERAKSDLVRLKKSEPRAYEKARKLLNELMDHPRTGTGHPEQLSGDHAGQWSRRISKKHRLIYEIIEMKVYVVVLAAYGHYDEK